MQRGIISIYRRDLLGAGEQTGVGRSGSAGRNILRSELVVTGLIALDLSDHPKGKRGMDFGIRIGQEGRRPILVGDAEPGIGNVERDVLSVLESLITLFL